SLGYHAGFLGEGEISYAGTAAVERAETAGDILNERLSEQIPDIRIDFIGMSSVHRTEFGEACRPYEVRVRAAGYHHSKQFAESIGEEVESLYLNGPAGGGGARKKVSESIGVVSSFIPRDQIKTKVSYKEWK